MPRPWSYWPLSSGIHARFVEGGRHFTRQRLRPIPGDRQAANAWAELYFAGIGWLPFDATPAAPEAPPRDLETLPEKPEPLPDETANAGADLAGSGHPVIVPLALEPPDHPLLLLIGSVALTFAKYRHQTRLHLPGLVSHFPDPSNRCVSSTKTSSHTGLDRRVAPEAGETLVQFASRLLRIMSGWSSCFARGVVAHQPPALRPDRTFHDELEKLVVCASCMEQSLQADLAYWTYRFSRVLA